MPRDSQAGPTTAEAQRFDGARYVLEAPASVTEIPVGPEQMAVVGYGALASLALGVGVFPLSGLWWRIRETEGTSQQPGPNNPAASPGARKAEPVPAANTSRATVMNSGAQETAQARTQADESTNSRPVIKRSDDIYETHFGLSGKPFSLLPDPAFLYMSKQHSLSFAVLKYGLANNAGLTVLTGEIGCGKTTLLRHLLNEVNEDITVGMLTNTHPSFRELLQWISAAFGLEYDRRGKVALHQAFVDYLIEEYRRGRRTVLIVDEAQNMSPATLEELRMLSNVNVDDHLLLQLVLVGQPQLRRTLARPNLVQVAQRIGADYSLGGFEEHETREYITHRLRKVGGEPGIFAAGTHELIHRSSGGIPRVINILCDTGLVYAYGSMHQEVGVELMADVIRDRDRFRGISPADPFADGVTAPSSPSASRQMGSQLANYARTNAASPTADSPLLSTFDDVPGLSAEDARELFSSLRDHDSSA